MPADMFLKISGIKGESTDSEHKDEIEIVSFSFGVSQQASAVQSSEGGGTTSRVNFSDISIMKRVDAASPLLFQHCAQGTHLDEVVLSFNRAGGDKRVEYYNYKLTNVVITAVQMTGSDSGDIPIETVAFNFGKINVVYKKQARKGGGESGDVPAGWDLQTNKKA